MPVNSDLAALLPRVSIGVLYPTNCVVLKLLTFGLVGTVSYFEGVGVPGWVAYVTFAADVVGGLMFILGVKVHWVALGLSLALLGHSSGFMP